MVSDGIRAVFQTFGLSSFAICFYHVATHPTEKNQGYGGNAQFLTIWALCLSAVSLSLGLLNSLSLSVPLLQFFGAYFSLLAVGLNSIIAVSYFGISKIDSTLMRSPGSWPSPLIDTAFHINPLHFIATDILFSNFRVHSPPSLASLILLSYLPLMSYSMWVDYCLTRNRWYACPVLGKVQAFNRGFGVLALGAIMGLIGWGLRRSEDLLASGKVLDQSNLERLKPHSQPRSSRGFCCVNLQDYLKRSRSSETDS